MYTYYIRFTSIRYRLHPKQAAKYGDSDIQCLVARFGLKFAIASQVQKQCRRCVWHRQPHHASLGQSGRKDVKTWKDGVLLKSERLLYNVYVCKVLQKCLVCVRFFAQSNGFLLNFNRFGMMLAVFWRVVKLAKGKSPQGVVLNALLALMGSHSRSRNGQIDLTNDGLRPKWPKWW